MNYTAVDLTGNCSNGIQDFGESDVDCGFALNMSFYYAQAVTVNPMQLRITAFESQRKVCAHGGVECQFPETIVGVYCPQRCAAGKKCRMPGLANESMDYPVKLFNGRGTKGHDCSSGFCEDSFNTGDPRCVRSYRKVPKMLPRGGRFTHPIKVRLSSFRNQTGDRVHYTLVKGIGSSSQIGSVQDAPSKESPFVYSGGFVLVDEDSFLIAASYASDNTMISSTVAVGSFEIARGRYGYGYFVPYYNSAIGFSGMLTRLDLQSPGMAPDFSNFQTRLGQGAFDGQLRVLDLTLIDTELKGFQGGFQSVGMTVNQSVTNFAFMVPFFNGKFHGKLVRVNLDYFSLCAVQPRDDLNATEMNFFDPSDGTWSKVPHPRHTATAPLLSPEHWKDTGSIKYANTSSMYDSHMTNSLGEISLYTALNSANLTGGKGWKDNFCGVEVIDLETEIDADLTGFNGGFAWEGWGYLVPYTNGRKFTSTVVRFNVSDFTKDTVETLDVSKALAAQCRGINFPHDTPKRSTTVDPVLCSKSLAGFNGGVTYDGKGYLLPYKHAESVVEGQHSTNGANSELPVDGGQFETLAHGLLVRFDLRSFDNTSVEVLDLTARDDDLRGYSSGFVHERWLYLVPYISRHIGHESSTPSRRNGYHGKLTRVDLDRFDLAHIEFIDLQDLDVDLRGFSAGFSWGDFGYLVPFTNDELNFREKKTFGKVVKLDLRSFTLSSVEVINLPTMSRQQVPPIPDHNLRGFSDGFAVGDFGYFVPNFNGDFFGKVVRMNLITDEIQVIDMQQDGDFLSGYSGGFSHYSRRICCDPEMGHRPDVCRRLDFDQNSVSTENFQHDYGLWATCLPKRPSMFTYMF
jgi:hypothetical protein